MSFLVDSLVNPVLVIAAALKVKIPTLRKVYIMGSTSVYGNFPFAEVRVRAAGLPVTADVDVLLLPYIEEVANMLEEVLGYGSQFYFNYGMHVDVVDESTCVLPVGWLTRVKPLANGLGMEILCLDVYDACVSKLVRGEVKDRMYVRILLDAKFIDLELLIKRCGFLDDQQIKRYEGNAGSKHGKQDILRMLRSWR